MTTQKMYDFSISMVSDLGENVEEKEGTVDFSSFLRIRRELNYFLLNLNQSNRAEGAGQQIHFLFVAPDHLENAEKKIRISGADKGNKKELYFAQLFKNFGNIFSDYIKFNINYCSGFDFVKVRDLVSIRNNGNLESF